LEKKPTDIDITMAGDPKKIDKIIDKTGMSYFMTEKFGTMTLIHQTKGTRDKDPGNKKTTPSPKPQVPSP